MKEIVSDIDGPYSEAETSLRLVTDLGEGSRLKLSIVAGVEEGYIGELYIGGERVEGGRFKVTKVAKTYCLAKTNASADTAKKATKIIIKIPE